MAVTRNQWMRRLAIGMPHWIMSVGLTLVLAVAAQADDYYPRDRGTFSGDSDRLLESLEHSAPRPDDRGGSYQEDSGYRGSYSTGNPGRYDDRSMGGSDYSPRRSRPGSEYGDRASLRSLRDPLNRTRVDRVSRPRYDDAGTEPLDLRHGTSRDDRYRDDSYRNEAPRLEERFRPSYDRMENDRPDPRLERPEYDRPEPSYEPRPTYDRGPERGPGPERNPGYERGPGNERPPEEFRRPDRRMPNNNPGPIPTRNTDDSNNPQVRQRKIAARYGNPVIQRLVQSVSPQQGIRLYQESMQLIDTRHLQPSSYEMRVRTALTNLIEACQDRGFQQANGVTLGGQQVAALESSLSQVMQRPVQGSSDAVSVLQWTMDAAGRSAGIRPGAVVVEFMFGATDSLDKYSSFMPEDPNRPSAEKETKDQSAAVLEDHVVGIGVEIKPDERGALVKKALPGGPAAEAGLQPGDLIVAVDGHSLQGQTLDYAVDLIAGRAGTKLQLTVTRGERQATMTMIRRQVQVASVSDVQMLDRERGIGYIRLEKFAQSSDQEVDKALWTLHQQGMQSLVFDLRGNPGGLLTTAVSLADKFLPSGTIVATRGRTPQDNTSETAKKEQTWKTPMVVLIDEDSASASEIFAAAIQDNHRGIVVGRHSYGKGTVQTHFPLQTVSGYLKLTTAKFYSPSGREMAGQGVEPDVLVNNKRNDETTLQNDSDVATAVRVAGSGNAQQMLMGGK